MRDFYSARPVLSVGIDWWHRRGNIGWANPPPPHPLENGKKKFVSKIFFSQNHVDFDFHGYSFAFWLVLMNYFPSPLHCQSTVFLQTNFAGAFVEHFYWPNVWRLTKFAEAVFLEKNLPSPPLQGGFSFTCYVCANWVFPLDWVSLDWAFYCAFRHLYATGWSMTLWFPWRWDKPTKQTTLEESRRIRRRLFKPQLSLENIFPLKPIYHAL